ncbi:ABC transporter substrate-binding protein [Roseibacterium beibuensis]|uniref:ABC transporter substrate-binding protein n=1 Tax=[Roseibacterium] beibuensis TaxID=1193142 RepID=A0ABP9LGE4_9RHOB|nr:ABC transporter substrate-binding protein [Roseibacterium beibuensis]MCS6623058.1 ABC transporter substrate-binding protein [Roseibacterium beibuensis]
MTLAAATSAWADAPTRVVSMNLCTDQLAMMLAAPGQLISVSQVAVDPLTSPMAEEAAAYDINFGSAEEIYLLDPDLVLAGVYSDPATVGMLRRLGVRVEQIAITQRLVDVPDRLREVGALLGRETRAETLIAAFETDLARLTHAATGPRAAFYFPNGYTLGTGTLSHDILTTAGFTHIAEELGRSASGRLALELLAMAAPELVIGSTPYAGASRSEEILRHPALQAVIAAGRGTVSGPDWVCGTPHVINALENLTRLRTEMEAAR